MNPERNPGNSALNNVDDLAAKQKKQGIALISLERGIIMEDMAKTEDPSKIAGFKAKLLELQKKEAAIDARWSVNAGNKDGIDFKQVSFEDAKKTLDGMGAYQTESERRGAKDSINVSGKRTMGAPGSQVDWDNQPDSKIRPERTKNPGDDVGRISL